MTKSVKAYSMPIKRSGPLKACLTLFKCVTRANKHVRYVIDKEAKVKSLAHGLIIKDEVLTHFHPQEQKFIVDQAIKQYGLSANAMKSTFFTKPFAESDDERVVRNMQQLINYIERYQFNNHNAYVENYKPRLIDFEQLGSFWQKSGQLTEITFITVPELKAKIIEHLENSQALATETIDCYESLLSYYFTNDEILSLTINNRELACELQLRFSIIPKSGDAFIRLANYLLTDNTQVNRSNMRILQQNLGFNSFDNLIKLQSMLLSYQNEYSLIPLAQSFNRYKKWWMTIKSATEYMDELKQLRATINRISKLSKKHHTPTAPSLETITSRKMSESRLEDLIAKGSTSQLLKAYEALARQKDGSHLNHYVNRFAKIWVREGDREEKAIDHEHVYVAMSKLKAELDKRFSKLSSYTALIDPSQEIGFPHSDKRAFGSIPNGSVLTNLPTSLIVGVYWEENVDIDLSAVSTNDGLCSFRSHSTPNGTLSHSGDMTCLNGYHFASEWIRVDQPKTNDVIVVDVRDFGRYNSNDGQSLTYTFFIADANDFSPKQPLKNVIFHHSVSTTHALGTLGYLFTDGDDEHLVFCFENVPQQSNVVDYFSPRDYALLSSIVTKQIYSNSLTDLLKPYIHFTSDPDSEYDFDLRLAHLTLDTLHQLLKEVSE